MDCYEELLSNIKDIEDLSDLEYQKFKITAEKNIFLNLKPCLHKETIILNGTEVCSECGVVFKNTNSYEKDARYYGGTENHDFRDIARCHKRKSEKRTIYKDVEGMDFPDIIIQTANSDYQEILKDNIYRGANRKAIIVVCIFFSYINHGECRTTDEIRQKFGIKKKNMKEGFEKYCIRFPKSAKSYIDPKNLIRQIMIRANISFEHLRKVNKLCDFLENTSPILNRATPQSVAAAIVYFYICLDPEYKEKLQMTKMKFSNIVGLSDITITKLGKELQRIIQKEIKL